jgi:hypothetical protein
MMGAPPFGRPQAETLGNRWNDSAPLHCGPQLGFESEVNTSEFSVSRPILVEGTAVGAGEAPVAQQLLEAVVE